MERRREVGNSILRARGDTRAAKGLKVSSVGTSAFLLALQFRSENRTKLFFLPESQGGAFFRVLFPTHPVETVLRNRPRVIVHARGSVFFLPCRPSRQQ